MSIVLALALAASSSSMPSCSWDKPGVNPFVGDVAAAIDHYKDMPADVRSALKARVTKRDYDDTVSIKRDSITGKGTYDPAIRDMHFGASAVCGKVTRAKWTPTTEERGLVYCEKDQCIVVPTVCRNVSRITRKSSGAAPSVAAAVARPVEAPVTLAPVEVGGGFNAANGGVPMGHALQASLDGTRAVASNEGAHTSNDWGPPVSFPSISSGISSTGLTDQGQKPVVPPVVVPPVVVPPVVVPPVVIPPVVKPPVVIPPDVTPPIIPPIVPPVVSPVPEPESAAMLLAGLALLFGLSKRRR